MILKLAMEYLKEVLLLIIRKDWSENSDKNCSINC